MVECHGNKKAAVRLFKDKLGSKCPAKPKRFIDQWDTRVRSGKGCENLKAPGPKRKISPEIASKAAAIFLAGFKQRGSGQQLYFESLNQALRLSSRRNELRDILRDHQICTKTLWRAIRRAAPKMTTRSLTFYKKFTAVQMNTRLRVCRFFLKMRNVEMQNYLRTVVWIDAAKIWVHVPKNQQVWVDSGSLKDDDSLLIPDERAPGKRGDKICLAYYAAVNHEIGPVYFKLTTGTVGVKGFKPAQVRSRLLFLRFSI